MLREEQGNSAMDSRQRALELRRASNAPKVYPPGYRIEQGSATEGPVDPSRDEQRSNVKVGALSGIRRLERAVKSAAARCPRAGRPVKPPGRYVVDKGDTLWSIAARHYGDGSRYRIIVRANRKQISDADMIRPCQRLYVPKAR